MSRLEKFGKSSVRELNITFLSQESVEHENDSPVSPTFNRFSGKRRKEEPEDKDQHSLS